MLNYALLVISSLLLVSAVWYMLFHAAYRYSTLAASSCCTVFLVLTVLFLFSDYFTGEGINAAVFFHVQYGLKGTGFGAYRHIILAAFLGLLIAAFLPYVIIKRIRPSVPISTHRTSRRRRVLANLAFPALTFVVHPFTIGVIQHIDFRFFPEDTAAFHRIYRKPRIVERTEPKNLVYIYAESLERTFFDSQRFPGLMRDMKAIEAVSTSFTQIAQAPSTGWTIAGITASQCGLPLITPSGGNAMTGMDLFLQKAVCLGDLLAGEGYRLSYLCGSKLDFAGTGTFFKTHGFKDIEGETEIEATFGPRPKRAWGIYDDTLFDIAAQKFFESAAAGGRFGLFISTMDTHPPKGSVSPSCIGRHDRFGDGSIGMLNAVTCSDHLIAAFVNRILTSEFADTTTIVITSDHLAMRNDASGLLETENRHDLFLVISKNQPGTQIERRGSMLDVAPTTLSFLGFTGDVGLGRNLSVEDAAFPKASDLESFIERHHGALRKFWGFPKLDTGDDIAISPRQKTVSMKNRAFAFPILIERYPDGKTVLKFTSEESPSLREEILKLKFNARFVWVDRCRDMCPEVESDYCSMVGKAGSLTSECGSVWQNRRFSVVRGGDIQRHTPDAPPKSPNLGERQQPNRFIAHAGGKIDDHVYTNSLEALDLSYEKGFRLFELDIIRTADARYVAAHDWTLWQEQTGYQGSLPPPHDVFKQRRILGRYTPMDLADINTWFSAHRDAILVTDKVNTPRDFADRFTDKSRLMMELFTVPALQEGLRSGIASAMPTWDLFVHLPGDRIQTLLSLGVTQVVAGREVIATHPQLLADLRNAGIDVFVFHLNTEPGKDERYAVCHDMDDVFGIYADTFDFEKPVDCP